MKKYFIIILTLLLVGCNNATQSFFGPAGLNLKGDVVSIKQVAHNELGQVISPQYFENGYEMYGVIDFVFSNNGLEATRTEYDDYENKSSEVTQVYDKKGYIISESYKGLSDDWMYKYVAAVDKKGMVILEDNVSTGECEYKDGGKGNFEIEFSYNDDGKLVETVDYDEEGKNEEVFIVNYYYNDENLIYNVKYSSSTAVFESYEFEYEDGIMTSYEVNYDGDVYIYEFEHEFDETGNWIEMIVTIEGQFAFIIERKIEYK